MSSALYKVFIKIISAFSAFIMLFTSPGGQISMSKIKAAKCPKFYGQPAQAKYLGEVDIPQHPYLAPEGVNGMHGNSYATDAYSYSGPLGINPVVKSKSMNVFGGLVATLMFDSKGRIMCVSGNVVGFRLLLLDPDTFEILAETRLPQRASTREFFKTLDFDKITNDTSGGAYCHLLDGDRPLIGNSENIAQIYKLDETGDKPVWTVEKEYDLSGVVTDGDTLTDVIPDYDGYFWFLTRNGKVGTIEPDSGEIKVMQLKNEEIQNSLSVSEDGVYIVSDYAMYRFVKGSDGTPEYTWRTEYDRGTCTKPGAINQGSGTTPTLLDCKLDSGSVRKVVAITDNADGRVNLVVYDRMTGEVIVCVPLFDEGHSVSENSIIAYDNSFIIENNYSDNGAGFLVSDPRSYPGVTKIQMNGDCTDCSVAWHSDEASCTVVPKLSTGNGLVYLYTRVENDDIPKNTVAWYLTAVDFETGETVYKVFTGIGKKWNNSYGPITIGPNGSAYVGVFNGVISITDSVK